MHIAVSDLTTLLGRWDNGPGSLYSNLAAGLLRLLETGQIETGAKLPPERRLAAALAISRNTVSAAYAELRRDGWIDARQGSATTVTAARFSPVAAHRANALFATLMRDHPDVVDLTIAVPPAAPIVTDVMMTPAAYLDDPTILTAGHGYHPRGHPLLRAVLARILTRNGLPTEEDEVLVTGGAQQAISLVTSALTRKGDAVGVEEVSFPGALDAIAAAGARAAPIRYTDRGVDEESLLDVITRERPRMLYLIPTFHNPTGVLLEGSARRRLASLIAETETTTVDDLTLAELDFRTAAPAPLAALEPDAPIISIGGMSKVFWGGLRIGWVRARRSIITHLAGRKATADLGSSAAAQVLASVMLEHYEPTRAWRNQGLAETLDVLSGVLDEHLPDWRFDAPKGGPHLWIEVPGTDTLAFSQLMLRHGVALIAGPLLAARDGIARDRIRVPYYKGSVDLVDAVERIAAVWHSEQGSARLRLAG